MKLGKIFKVFKKGAKVAGKQKGKKPVAAFKWPGGVRIGVFGHANSGKTVYFTVLNEECKIARNLQISVTDNMTAGEFLSHYRSLWGLGTSGDAGTVVDFRGEKKFPDPTETDKVLQFNAIIDRKKKVPVVAYDYSGKAVSISDRSDLTDKVIDFMSGCDGLLFFYDPKIMGAELESQAHVASFVNMLELLAPLKSRLPIPMAVVVTKADILPGFSGDEQVRLISPGDEYLVAEEFELFFEKVLTGAKLAANPAWAGSVRTVLVRLKEFLRVVFRRTLDFQMFFVSCTGQTPEKIGTDVGRSLYTPPAKMQPIGVKEPFYWLLNSIIRNRRISRFRAVAKYAAVISIIWALVFSIPFVFHFKYLFPKPERMEQTIKDAHNGSILGATPEERNQIIREYDRYERARTVQWFFEQFRGPARRISAGFREDNLQKAINDLNSHIATFAAIVTDTNLWPKVNPSDTALILDEAHKRLVAALEGYHTGDSSSILFARSGRALVYWDLFGKGVLQPADTLVWQTIQQQVQTDKGLYAQELSREETDLGQALSDRKIKKVKKVTAQKAGLELDDLIERINGNPSPEYRLETAVAELRKIKGEVDADNLKKINAYLAAANKWKNQRTFTYVVESVTDDGHLHIDVTEKGQEPTWADEEQKLAVQGLKYQLQWKVGDEVHIALDMPAAPENWGRTASDRRTFRGDYALFDLEAAGTITFEKTGAKAAVRFIPSPQGQLPELK